MQDIHTNTTIDGASGNSRTQRSAAEIGSFIASQAFPCVGAKSALNKDRMRFGHCGKLGTSHAATQLRAALSAFIAEFPDPGPSPVSFVAMFDPEHLTEMQFEERLWAQLELASAEDARRGATWDARVGQDPDREDFSFSIAGRAFFVVGMHAQASRMARRTPFPCLVFNFHEQFEALKSSGKYQTMQKAIRARDVDLQGCINPVLARFGEASEARQYSGRAVEENWKCPFHHQHQS